MTEPTASGSRPHRPASDIPFHAAIGSLAGLYVLLILVMLASLASYTTPANVIEALRSPEIRYAIRLSLISCTLSTLLSLWVAVPTGYLMSRGRFRGKALLDGVLDIPIVLPPLVVGIALLILFNRPWAGGWKLEDLFSDGVGMPVTYAVPAVVLAQFVVACAFAVRTMRVTFDHISPRTEQVALTLGCNRSQAFWSVILPQAWRGVLAAGTLAWARSLGEFGPILVFAGATRMRTEVLPTSIFLELGVGNVRAAVAVSLLMVTVALVILILARLLGARQVAT